MTIWYDYTTTLRSTGRNGIANVEWSVGASLRDERPDVRAFALEPRRGLVVIDPDTDLRDAVYARSEPAPPTVGATTPGGRSALRIAVADLLSTRAPWMIPPVAGALRLARTVSTRVRSWSPPRRTGRQPLGPSVGSGDVIVSMGADWSGELADELARLRVRSGCRVVTMVYDLIPLNHPHLAFHNDPAFFGEYYERLLRTSDLITCISEQTRRDLLDFASARGVAAPSVVVLRLGEAVATSSEEPQPRAEFHLWVGTVERRKNLELLYDALRILESEGADVPTIVVAGGVGWGVADLLDELSHQSSAASRAIVLLGPVDDATLDRLYRRARSLLFPSSYEGWGLPVREAAIRGCPVAVGDNPAVREATADLVGATVLPVDDPGPWARFLAERPPSQPPAEHHPWSVTASALLALVDQLGRADEVTGTHR